jgi:hypothetical protein
LLQQYLVLTGCATTNHVLADLARVEGAAVLVVEVDGDGLSAATRGAMRRGKLDHFLSPKHACDVITVASSTCRNSAASLKPCALAHSAKLAARLRAAGADVRGDALYLDVGVDTDLEEAIGAFAQAIALRAMTALRPDEGGGTVVSDVMLASGGTEGDTAQNPGEIALTALRPDEGGGTVVSDAMLASGGTEGDTAHNPGETAYALGRLLDTFRRAVAPDVAGGCRERAIMGSFLFIGGGLCLTMAAAAAARLSHRLHSKRAA